jgi:hypothetical protein
LLPAGSLHVIISFFSQFLPAFGTSSFQYFLTTLGLHAGSKAMLPDASATLGLISSLWHCQ